MVPPCMADLALARRDPRPPVWRKLLDGVPLLCRAVAARHIDREQ